MQVVSFDSEGGVGMLKVGFSCGARFDGAVAERLAEAGFKSVEVALSHKLPDDFDCMDFRRVADEYGIELWSMHLPFVNATPFDFSSLDPEVRKTSLDFECKTLQKGLDAGIKRFVVHPCGGEKSLDPRHRIKTMELSKQGLSKLCDIAEPYGAVIAVENMPRTGLGRTVEEMQKLTEHDERLKVCFDVNHLLCDDHHTFWEALKEKIATLHISDYDFIDEKHWLPGEGAINWHTLYNMMIQSGFKGVWMYEIALKSTDKNPRSRDLTFRDVYNNAVEIFQNKQITKI